VCTGLGNAGDLWEAWHCTCGGFTVSGGGFAPLEQEKRLTLHVDVR
jgi:hypothetical protein